MKTNKSRGTAVENALTSKSIVDLGKEYMEIGIDAALESGVLKDIPFVNTIVSIFNTAGTAREHIFMSKLIRFLNHLSEITEEQRIEMVTRLNEDDSFAGKVGQNLIEILDRMESDKKPELAAKCFAAYAKNEISVEELRRILLSLERVPSFDIEKIEHFSTASMDELMKIDESISIAFVNAGLGINNGGLDGGIIIPTKLCKKFVATCIKQ